MKATMKFTKLEDEPIWQEANYLAEYIYAKLPELPEDEKWTLVPKLRSAASDLIFYASEALGNASPAPSDYDWGGAHKHAAGLKTMYRFACRQNYIELEPEIMVRFDKLIALIEKALVANRKKTEEVADHELEQWRKKYKIWKEIQS